jgi:hypothetical protein
MKNTIVRIVDAVSGCRHRRLGSVTVSLERGSRGFYKPCLACGERIPCSSEEQHSSTVNNCHFPLQNAYLCQDCDAVSNNANQCPACASEVLMNLATVMDREGVAA